MESTIIRALDEHGGGDRWSQTPAGLVELNVRLLARTAKEFDGMRPV